MFIKTFIKKIKFDVFFYDESIIESRGKEVSRYIGNKKVNFFDHSYNASPFSLNKQILSFNERKINQKIYTVLLAPMKGFYINSDIGKTQVRLSLVEDPFLLSLTPDIIASLFKSYSRG